MKEHAKKALKHDISVFGKSVPIVAIAALFLVGGGSAALLSSFGTVSGTASVDQAIAFDGGATDLDYDFGDQTTVAGETTVQTETVDNNADVSASYKFVTSGTEKGVDSRIYRGLPERSFALVKNSTEVTQYDLATDTTVDVDYEESGDHVTFTFDKEDFSNHGAAGPVLAYDSNNDGTYDFLVDMTASAIPDYWTYDGGGFSHSYEFKTEDGNPDYTDSFNGVSFSTDGDVVTMEVDRGKLGDTFSFLASTGSDKFGTPAHPTNDLSEDDTQLVQTFGPQAGTGASNDLEKGTVTRTYQNGEVTFNFSDPEASPTLGVDSDNNGVYDWHLDLAASDIPDYYEWSDSNDDWSAKHMEFKDSSDNPDYGTEYEGIVVQKNSESLTVTFDESKVSDTYRYDIGIGEAFPNKDSGESNQAEVVTTGVETLGSDESQDYVFVNNFAVNLDPSETYSITTKVVPVTE